VVVAPKDAGIGEWNVVGDEGDLIRGRYIRKAREKKEKEKNGHGHANGK
jgi:hypothetical protein